MGWRAMHETSHRSSAGAAVSSHQPVRAQIPAFRCWTKPKRSCRPAESRRRRRRRPGRYQASPAAELTIGPTLELAVGLDAAVW